MLAVTSLLFALVIVIGVEVTLVARRQYLGADHSLELDAAFGAQGHEPPLRFVVLGDSTSVGVGARDPSEAYPVLLARRLASHTGRRVELAVVGSSGAKVGDVAEVQVPRAAELDPDLIFIGIGANDVTHLTALDEVRDAMRRALESLETTGASVVVAGAPDMRIAAWPQPLRSLAYLRGKQVAGAIEDVARDRGVAVVELAEATGHYFAQQPATHFSADGFHPGPLGYRRWADAIFPVLIEVVTTSLR